MLQLINVSSPMMLRSAVLAALIILPKVFADLPVHCLRHQMVGDWVFTLSPTTPKRTSCGHAKPDTQYRQPSMEFVTAAGQTSTKKFTLQDPSTATTEDGSMGTWTMIYDEGFEVAIGEMVYFAFSKFEFVPDGHGRKTNISHCGETEVGWYHDKSRTKWGCYYAKKVGEDPHADIVAANLNAATASAQDAAPDQQQVTSTPPPLPQVPAAPPQQQTQTRGSSLASLSAQMASILSPDSWRQDNEPDSANQDEAQEGPGGDDSAAAAIADAADEQSGSSVNLYHPWVPGSPGYDHPMKSEWQQSVADALNLLQLGWRAATYVMFTGKTPRELNRLAGVRRDRANKPTPPEKRSIHKHHDGRDPQFSSFLGFGSKVRRNKGPEVFDWRQKDGQSWLQPVVTQGDCGSCYTISTVHMLTARNRIRRGDMNEPAFSVSFPLYCSEYNQGCDGGYGFLQSKWTEDVGLVPEACAPFSQGGGQCEVTPDCNLGAKRYRGVDHHYVGGFYGGSDEEEIKRELVSGGPLVMSFEPKEDFMYYKSGIYKSGPNKIHQEWEQVDHAVLLVAYGAEAGQAYWSMQNSWGPEWGEAGFFRMARGTDESGCESIVVAADVTESDANPVLDDFLASMAEQ